MKKVIWTIIIIIALVLIGYLISSTDGGDVTDTDDDGSEERSEVETLIVRAQAAGLEVTEGSVLIDLDEQNDSGIDGIAVLTELDNEQTRVAVSLEDEEAISRPIHIHRGTCDDLGDIEYSLESVVDEFSNSSIPVTFDDLESEAPLAINAHESDENMETYISCGNLEFGAVADAEVIERAGGGSDQDNDDVDNDDTATTTEDDDADTDEDEDNEAEAGGAVVTYTNTGFDPQTLIVTEGTTVKFVNESSGGMWVASAVHPTHEILPSFDQGTSIGTDGEYEYTFDELGTWNFHNHVSANHTGTIIVE